MITKKEPDPNGPLIADEEKRFSLTSSLTGRFVEYALGHCKAKIDATHPIAAASARPHSGHERSAHGHTMQLAFRGHSSSAMTPPKTFQPSRPPCGLCCMSGSRGVGGFPHLQPIPLCEVGTHAMVDGVWGSYVDSERVGGRILLRLLEPGRLALWDGAFQPMARISLHYAPMLDEAELMPATSDPGHRGRTDRSRAAALR